MNIYRKRTQIEKGHRQRKDLEYTERTHRFIFLDREEDVKKFDTNREKKLDINGDKIEGNFPLNRLRLP